MKYYDPILTGWGIDYLNIWALGQNKKRAYAIIDAVSCVNPHDDKKKIKIREIERYEPTSKSVELWYKVKKRYKIPTVKNKVYSEIKL